MSCRVPTADLIALLTDLLATAEMAADAGAIGSIMLHTTRAQLGPEPGRTDPGPRIYRSLMRPTRDVVESKNKVIVAEALPRTDVRPAALVAFSKVGKRRGMPVEVYRTHQNEPVHVQIGHAYRGMLLPLEYHAESDERSPAAEVHPPDLAALEKLIVDTAKKNTPAPAQPQPEPLFSTSTPGGS